MQKYPSDQISFLLTNVLRHTPEDLGITLDAKGWTDIEILVAEANKRGIQVSEEDILNEVAKNERDRFSISKDGKMIRANHGHSVLVDAELKIITPPDALYHRTNPKFIDSILKEGLFPQKRMYVHLATSKEYLYSYEYFDAEYAILQINSKSMLKDGYVFYSSGDSVICTKIVPPEYLSIINY